jgi:hypothetical protein
MRGVELQLSFSLMQSLLEAKHGTLLLLLLLPDQSGGKPPFPTRKFEP